MWLVLTLALVLPTISAESHASPVSGSPPSLSSKDHLCTCGLNCAGRCCCLRKASARQAQATPTPTPRASAPLTTTKTRVCLTSPPCGSHEAPAGATFSALDSLDLGRLIVITNPRTYSQPFLTLADLVECLGRSTPPAKPPRITHAG